MPQVLENPAAGFVIQLGSHEPVVISLVVTQGTSTYLLLRLCKLAHRCRPLLNKQTYDCELCTAWRGDNFGDIGVVENTDPSASKCNLGRAPVQLSEWLDFIGTPGTPVTSQVNIARLFKVVELESLHGESVVLLHEFDVRAAAVRMEEDDVVRERLVIVVIHDVLKVGIALLAFVLLDGVLSIRVVDHVDCMLPAIVRVDWVRIQHLNMAGSIMGWGDGIDD